MDNQTYNNQIFINKPQAEIKEVKSLPKPNDNVLRVYCLQHPNVFVWQIRTHKPIDQHQVGKPRDMIANVTLTIEEVEDILRRMKGERASVTSQPPQVSADNESEQDADEFEKVDFIASGYEWICLHCEELNKEIEIKSIVSCLYCYYKYNTGEANHAHG